MLLMLMKSAFKCNRTFCRKLMTMRKEKRTFLKLQNANSYNNLILKANLILTSPMAGDQHEMEVKEFKIPVPYGHIAAKAWGRETGSPILALHGWMDNAGTFDKLIPLLLPSLYIVAIDMPGHGLSSHKPLGSFYSPLDTIIYFKRVVDHLQWTKFSIIGHSMGAAFGQLYASTFPESVQKFVALDLGNIMLDSLENLPEISAAVIKENLKTEQKMLNPPPMYSFEEAMQRMKEGMFNEISDDAAITLMKRGIRLSDCGNGYIFNRDLRVRTILTLHGSSDQVLNGYLSDFTCETLLILSENTHPYLKAMSAQKTEFIEFHKKQCKKFLQEDVEGNHFVHLNHPERIAHLINCFLR